MLLLEYIQLSQPIGSFSANEIARLHTVDCSAAVRYRLDALLDDLRYSREHILHSHRQIKAFVCTHQELAQYVRYLQTIPGIGFVCAITILSRIGDPKLLRDVRELGSFLGLVPCEYSTGDNVNRGKITHLGNSQLRQLLTEAAWVTIRNDKSLGQFYHRVKARRHPQIAKKKAITAVARKLTQRIYCVLKEQRAYQVH